MTDRLALLMMAVAACSSSAGPSTEIDDGDVTDAGPSNSDGGDVQRIAIQARLVGLSGGEIGVSLNGGEPVVRSENGTFVFPDGVLAGSEFEVSISHYPDDPPQRCEVFGGTGEIFNEPPPIVAIECEAGRWLEGVSFAIESPVTLSSGEGQTITVTKDGPFRFPVPLPVGGSYLVERLGPPATAHCVIYGPAGQADADIDLRLVLDCGKSEIARVAAITRPLFPPRLTVARVFPGPLFTHPEEVMELEDDGYEYAIGGDGNWLVVTHGEIFPPSIYLSRIHGPATPPVELGDLSDERNFLIAGGSQHLYYRERTSSIETRLMHVDLSSDQPLPEVVYDGPLQVGSIHKSRNGEFVLATLNGPGDALEVIWIDTKSPTTWAPVPFDITDLGVTMDLMVSEDGSWVAFEAEAQLGADDIDDTYVARRVSGSFLPAQPIAGGVNFTDATPVGFTSDSQWLVISGYDGSQFDAELWAVPLAGGAPGTPVRVTPEGTTGIRRLPAFAPAGARAILTLQSLGSDPELFYVDFDDSPAGALIANSSSDPDSQSVVWDSTGTFAAFGTSEPTPALNLWDTGAEEVTEHGLFPLSDRLSWRASGGVEKAIFRSADTTSSECYALEPTSGIVEQLSDDPTSRAVGPCHLVGGGTFLVSVRDPDAADQPTRLIAQPITGAPVYTFPLGDTVPILDTQVFSPSDDN